MFIYRPAPDEGESKQEGNARMERYLIQHQKNNIFNYIRTATNDDQKEDDSFVGHIINQDLKRYYWNSWDKQELIARKPIYNSEDQKIIVRFDSLNGDGYVIFKQDFLFHPVMYCGWLGVDPYEEFKVELIEFRKNTEEKFKEFQSHEFGYSGSYRYEDCNGERKNQLFYLIYKTDTLFESFLNSFKQGGGE